MIALLSERSDKATLNETDIRYRLMYLVDTFGRHIRSMLAFVLECPAEFDQKLFTVSLSNKLR